MVVKSRVHLESLVLNLDAARDPIRSSGVLVLVERSDSGYLSLGSKGGTVLGQ